MFQFKRAFILGAGFSKSFCGCPTVPDFTKILIDEKENDLSKYCELTKFANKYYGLSNSYESIRNMESLATIILNRKIFYDEIAEINGQALRYDILRFIKDKIFESKISVENDSDVLKSFFKSCIPNANNSDESIVITFNYDLIVERLGTWVNYGVVDSYPVTEINEASGSPLRYLKLHGSLNWFNVKGSKEYNINNVKYVDESEELFEIHRRAPLKMARDHGKKSF